MGGGEEIKAKSWTGSTSKVIMDQIHDSSAVWWSAKLATQSHQCDMAVGVCVARESWTPSMISPLIMDWVHNFTLNRGQVHNFTTLFLTLFFHPPYFCQYILKNIIFNTRLSSMLYKRGLVGKKKKRKVLFLT